MKITIQCKALSINGAFQGRRFKTKECKKYEDDVYIQLPNWHISGFVSVRYDFYLKNWARTDADNLVKVLQDILVKKGLIEDDRKIMVYVIEKHKSETDYINVEIVPYDNK